MHYMQQEENEVLFRVSFPKTISPSMLVHLVFLFAYDERRKRARQQT